MRARVSRAPAVGKVYIRIHATVIIHYHYVLVGIPNAHNIAIRLLEILRPTRRHFITDTSWDTLRDTPRSERAETTCGSCLLAEKSTGYVVIPYVYRVRISTARDVLSLRSATLSGNAFQKPRRDREGTEQNRTATCGDTLSASHPPRTTLIAVRRPCGAPAAPSAGIVRVSCQSVLTISVTACLVARGASTSAGVGHLAWKFVCARAHYAAAPASCA